MQTYILAIIAFTIGNVTAMAHTSQEEDVYSVVRSDCSYPAEKLRCEQSLQAYWEVRKELTADERMFLSEKYLSLDLPPRADSKNRARGLEILRELAAEHPNQAVYPAIEAVMIAQLNPLQGIQLAHLAVKRFPDQDVAHSMLAVVLSTHSDELVAHHFRRSFELAVATADYPNTNITAQAVSAIEAIKKTEGPGGAKRFAQYAREQLNWAQWSERVFADAQDHLDANRFDARLAAELLQNLCVKNTVYLDEGELCDQAVDFIYVNVDKSAWNQEPLASLIEMFLVYFDEDTIVTKLDDETAGKLREMASS